MNQFILEWEGGCHFEDDINSILCGLAAASAFLQCFFDLSIQPQPTSKHRT